MFNVALPRAPSPTPVQARSFPSPLVPWLGTPSQCCTPPGRTACLPALLGSGIARGGSGWPGGWDNNHMKFPTLPHPIRKQAGRDAGGGGADWEEFSGWTVMRRGFHQLFRGVGGSPTEDWWFLEKSLEMLTDWSSQNMMFMQFSWS